MPLSTNFEVSPYFDDYQELKNFYKVLFKPGVPVQVRELNQLQTILQQQIERFGDNVFQKGTVIDGCHLTYHSYFPYVKVRDVTAAGKSFLVSDLEGYYLKNSANLQAFVVTTTVGYESQSPDLNTLFVRYINSGNTGSDTAFSANQVLTVFQPDNRIYSITINNGSTGFSNADTLVISSAIAVQNSVGGTSFANGFFAGDFISNGNGANVEIIEVDSTSNTEALILKIKPQTSHLLGGDPINWSIYVDEAVIDANTGETASVVGLVGQGVTGSIRTNSVGKINTVTVATNGSGYYVTPYVSVRTSTANSTQLNTLSLTPQNYLYQLTVAPTLTEPVGTGYGVTVSEGIVFQRGYFQRVEEQLAVVEKYSNTPDLKVVGFSTVEEVINSNIDDSLLDNATGSPNETAPGADRLKLTPTLVVLDKEETESNTEFLALAEFSQGAPFKQNKQTVYNIIGKEMARRTYEESGNYVVDQFILNTKSITPFANEASQFVTSVDPGVAYIRGERVETVLNYQHSTDKALDTQISTTATVSLNYGNYIKVNDLGGLFDFDVGARIELYSTAQNYLTSTPGTAISPTGTLLGYARIRSLILESGTPGTSNAVYRLYLFDIQMNAGKNFQDVKAVYHSGTNKGIADVVLVSSKCKLYDTNQPAVTYSAGVKAVKNSNNISYTYRTFNQGLSCNTSGIIQKTLPANETFSPTGSWTESDKRKILVLPLANVQYAANLAGSLTTSTSSPNVTGTSTSFTTALSPGDYIRFANTTANGYGCIASITNATHLILTSNASIAITGANAAVYFPQNVPVNMIPSTRTANVSANGSVLTIYLGSNVNAANFAVAYDVKAANVQPVSKTVSRDCWVRLDCSNNAANTVGPWCLGMADVFRLKGVYKGANNTFAYNDSGITDVTNEFYIDHNQNESFYDTSYLYKKPKSALSLSGSDKLLVKLDVFTTAVEGLKTIVSYPLNDTLPLDSLTSSVNTLELPEVFGTRDIYYDVRDQFDFRPVSANTANITSTLASATLNPVEPSATARFTSNDKKFPTPDSQLAATVEYYVGRTDRVVMNANGDIKVLKGEAGKEDAPVQPADALTINLLKIPPYPSVPFSPSANLVKIIDTKVANEKYNNKRAVDYRITTPITADRRPAYQPRGYTMSEIGKLESRIADLEYYILKLLSEGVGEGRVINDGSGTTRTKYGFFADDYNSSLKSDILNPEFNATIANGRLLPKLSELAFEMDALSGEFQAGDILTLPFIEQPLISQLAATDGAVEVGNTSPNTSPNTTPTSNTIVVQRITNVLVFNRNTQSSPNWLQYERAEYFMSANAGPVEFYFNSRQDDIAIEIHQGTAAGFVPSGTPLLTGSAAVAPTSAEKTIKCQGFLQSLTPLDTQGLQGSPPKFITDGTGKITWTHNPANGRYYKITIFKQTTDGSSHDWCYRLYYPVDSVETVNPVVVNPTTFAYIGQATSIVPSAFTIQASLNTSYGSSVPNYYFCDSQKFTITVTGLKPSTNHTFQFDGVDKSSSCQQVGKTLGAQMVSDASGNLTFDFYYDAGITEITTDYEQFTQLATSVAGIKAFKVISSDQSSKGTGSIYIKSYVQEAINTTTVTDTSTVTLTSGTGRRGTFDTVYQ